MDLSTLMDIAADVAAHTLTEAQARKLSAQNPLLPGGARPAAPAMPDMSASDCFAYFNPTSAGEMAKVAATWADALVVGSEFLNNRQRGRSVAELMQATEAVAGAAAASSKSNVL